MTAAGEPRSWYPAALSRDVAAKPRPLRVGGKDYVLFRDEGGRVAALSRYCLHMGADLASANVVGGSLRCRLHGWTYDRLGVCRGLGEQAPPKPTQLRRLDAHEAGGVIYIWADGTPDWPFPALPGMSSPRAARPFVSDFDCPMSAIGLNGFDIWHYRIVHRRDVIDATEAASVSPAHLGLSFTAKVRPGRRYDDLLIRFGYGTLHVRLDYWGGNLIFVRNMSGGYLALLALAPLGAERCRLYLTAFGEARHGAVGRLAQGAMLEVFRLIAWRFLKADVPAVSGMRPVEGQLVSGRDDAARRFWIWWRALPRVEAEAA